MAQEKKATLEEFKNELTDQVFNNLKGKFKEGDLDEALNQRGFEKDIINRANLREALREKGFFKTTAPLQVIDIRKEVEKEAKKGVKKALAEQVELLKSDGRVLLRPLHKKGRFQENFTAVAQLHNGPTSDVEIIRDKQEQFAIAKTVHSLENGKHEADMLTRLKHPGISPLLAVYLEEPIKLILPLYSIESEQPSSLEEITSYIYQLLKALEHCAEREIVHSDVAPRNLIRQPDGSVILIDFGLAQIAGTKWNTKQDRVKDKYTNPEILLSKGTFQPSMDIWSAGKIMKELIDSCKCGTADSDNLLQQMLSPRPTSRISASKALRHPFFSSFQKPSRKRKADGERSL